MARATADRTHRIIAYDPGSIRTGWAVLEYKDVPLEREMTPDVVYDLGLKYIASGVVHTPRADKEKFQGYRMRLAAEWTDRAIIHLNGFGPAAVVSEVVPSRGAGIPENFYLANVQIATVHAIAFKYHIPVTQISARTVQKAIAIRGNSKGVTKPQVRNGVLDRLPELQPRKKELTESFEESDALAIGLWYFQEGPGRMI